MFDYNKYKTFQDGEYYTVAIFYAEGYQGDKNADICLIYSKLSSGEYTADSSEVKRKLIDAYRKYKKSDLGYNKNVVYLLGYMLNSIGCNDASTEVLESIKNGKKDYNKKAKAYLEKHYFNMWKNTNDIDWLKKAADARYNTAVCYFYAEKIWDEDPIMSELYRDVYSRECEANQRYEDYIAKRERRIVEAWINQLQADVSTGFKRVITQTDCIKSMLNAFSEKLDSLEENVMNKLEAGFAEVNDITKSMRLLSAEQQANASLIFDYLYDLRDAMEQNQNATAEQTNAILNASAEQTNEILGRIIELTDSVKEAESKIQEQFDAISKRLVDNTFNSHGDPQLDAMVDSAIVLIDDRFKKQLDEEAERSLVSAIFTMAFYKKLSNDSISHTDFSGVAILATSALEIELNKRIYAPYLSFLKGKFYNNSQFIDNNKLTRIPAETTYKDKDDHYRRKFDSKLNLGSFPFITGCRGDEVNNRALNRRGCRNLFKEFLSSDKITGALKQDYANYLFDSNQSYGRMEDFSDRLDKVRVIRNKAAHSETVSESQAEQACIETFGTKGLEIAEQTNQDVLSLLDILVNSVNRFDPRQAHNHNRNHNH